MSRTKSVLALVSCLLTTLGSWAASTPEPVIVTEIYYHPLSTNLLEQWFEVYNAGADGVDLSGWRVTQGVDFVFSGGTRLTAGAYLVVAADGPVFSRLHPGVTNFVAGWSGTLGHVLELTDHSPQVVQSVQFYAQGDWAARRLGPPQFNHQGWEWYAAQDGEGASLELINAARAGACAQNWGSSVVLGGTPGRANSIASAHTAPFITEVRHAPVIPLSNDPVTVSARVVAESRGGLVVTLYWRVDGAATFDAMPMFDDGAHGDGVGGDDLFGATLPARPNGTVVEFYLTARDPEGHLRTYPVVIPPAGSARTANLLYQVDNSTDTGAQPVYRLVMREIERAELYQLGRSFPEADSDAQMNATWITTDGVGVEGKTTQIRYNTGVRNRGHGTRTSNPNNYHVNIPSDRLWKQQAGLNLNSHYAYSQVLGSAIFRKLEVPMADSRPVQLRVNGTNLMVTVGTDSFGSYAANEQYNSDFVKHAWPLDPRGNSYRGIRGPLNSGTSPEANLSWHGADFFVPDAYTNAYFKQNRFLENDYSDLLRLIGVLNEIPGYAGPDTYVTAVREVLNVEQWMRYLAINTLLQNDETCLANGTGDDYALYRGALDRRFVALPYDLDTVMGRGLTTRPALSGIWRMTDVPVMDRFVKTPEFAPVYLRQLRDLATGAFSPGQMNPFVEQVLGNEVPRANLDNMKAFNANQVAHVLSLIPMSLSVQSSLPAQSGYPRATAATVELFGGANAIDTQRILVNGAPAAYTAWQGRWTNRSVALAPGLNRVLVQAFGANGLEVGRTNLDVWYDAGSVANVGGALGGNTTWTAAGGPYQVTANLTVNTGATLTIAAGTTVYLGSGVGITVASGGRLLAEGTAYAPIRFTRAPGGTASWGGVTINGGAGTPETRLAYARFEFNGATALHSAGGTVFLDHLAFGSTDHQYVSLDSSSFVVSHCDFPTPTAAFELVHGTGGIKSGGRGIFYRNFFGTPNGYNDVVDFTGGNRPGQPLVHFLDNVFAGASDDALDLDGTDAWIEGNIFLHVHKNGAPDSSSAVSGGNTGADTSEITIIGNLIYDCDQAATGKQGNFYTLINNTIVHQSHQGGTDTDGAVVNLADDGTTEGAGMYLEGNIIFDAEKLVRNQTASLITFTNNLLSLAWSGPGGNNPTNAPLFQYLPKLSETCFTSWEQAQVMREWFLLEPGSPARGAGPNGLDQGGVIPLGASLSGEPVGTNATGAATLTVGINRAGNGIPTAGFPNGSGYTAYMWRLDGGEWSAETPIATPITLNGLANGPHYVEVTGKRDTGLFQDNPEFGEDAVVTRSRAWVVDNGYVPPAPQPTVRLNEVLAQNTTTLTYGGKTPDLVELHNFGPAPLDLSGLGLSDNAARPYPFTFPAGTTLQPGGFLTVFADSDATAPGLHLGFVLQRSGGGLYLRQAATRGGALLDSLTFGLQVADLSIGRRTDGSWGLCRPTFGAANVALALGDERTLKINEWLADAQFVATDDYVELCNPDPLPVALGGLSLSDASGAPAKSPLPALSFIAGRGFAWFIADGHPNQGADHLNFQLSPEVGLILLSAADLSLIDAVAYGPQRSDVAQGRSPNGADTLVFLGLPTPGGANPGVSGGGGNTEVITLNLMAYDQTWKFDQRDNLDGIVWTAPGYDDSAWPAGQGLLAFENNAAIVPLIHQNLADPRPAPPGLAPGHAYYFRTTLDLTNDLTGFNLELTLRLDDGGVIYVNGAEVLRPRMPAGAVNHATLTESAQQPSGGDATADETFALPASALIPGRNVIAAEVHQSSTNSSDITWGMALVASKTVTHSVPGSAAPILLNEVLANHSSLTNAPGALGDFVELYNTSTNAADLSGLSLTDDSIWARKWVFPPGSSLGGGGYLIIHCDGAQPASATNTGFGLKAAGGAVFLFNALAGEGSLADALYYGLQAPDYSLGRFPSGSGGWTLTLPTPGRANAPASLGPVSALRINEWMAAPSAGPDWFEIYNSSTQPIALGGLFLTDDLADKTQSPIAPLSYLGAGTNGFVVFFADGKANAGPDHLSFSLKKSGEVIGLFSLAGTPLDAVAFGAQLPDVSQGRFPDGSANLVSFPGTASPQAANYLQPVNPDADGDGLPDAWELQHFGTLSRDGTGDFDGDGMTDLQEWVAGTNPADPSDSLRLGYLTVTSPVTLEFIAVAGKSYTVEYRDALDAGAWRKLGNQPSPSITGPVRVSDTAPTSGSRFYRLVTPARP